MDRPDQNPENPTTTEQWHRWTDWPLVAAAFLFLGAYAWPILDPALGHPWLFVCNTAMAVTWVAFVVDYAVRLWIAPNRWRFVRTNLVDLAIITLPILRPLRLLRLLTVLTVLNRTLSVTFRSRISMYAALGTTLLIVVAALAVLDAERGMEGANIQTFADALWWALVTITTVGYGDFYPVTTEGRFIAVGLFIGGIALVGVVTGSLSSWFIEKVRDSSDRDDEQAAIRTLTAEVRALRRELDEQEPAEAATAASAEPGSAPPSAN
ncbi:potassium channel family protein [Nocardiopsis sp. LOL_012]|uniref:potassium channel family protein n=1 Tax=Nocardiopsis sp. LOL_012 TaxID=3345409 RepID=UPI003A8A83A0